MTDNNKNGNHPGPMPAVNQLPPVINQIVINLHKGGHVTGNMPTNMTITMHMLGEFLKQIGPTLRYEPPSPIVQPPKGLIIPGGN